MKSIAILILFTSCFHFFSATLYAQTENSSINDTNTVIEDFNADGEKEQITTTKNSEGSSTETVVEIGTENKKPDFTITSNHGFSNFIELAPLDDDLFQKKNRGYVEAIAEHGYGVAFYQDADPTLQWLFDIHTTYRTGLETDMYDMIFSFNPNWKSGEIMAPESYAMVINGDSLQSIYEQQNGESEVKNIAKNTSRGLAVYHAHNHLTTAENKEKSLSPELIAEVGNTKVYKTKHGVILKKGKKYLWCFVSNGSMPGSPDKLRHASILDVEMHEGLLYIKQQSAGWKQRLFVIDPDSGLGGRVGDKYFYSFGKDHDNHQYELMDGNMIIDIDGQTFLIQTKYVKEQLSQ
jgi:hypothetical protein